MLWKGHFTLPAGKHSAVLTAVKVGGTTAFTEGQNLIFINVCIYVVKFLVAELSMFVIDRKQLYITASCWNTGQNTQR